MKPKVSWWSDESNSNPMGRSFAALIVLYASTLCGCVGTWGDRAASKEVPLTVALYDSSGETAASSRGHRLNLLLLRSDLHMHFRLSNVSNHSLRIWSPGCPQGDDSIIVEFRRANDPGKVYRAWPGWSGTAGGWPSTFVLAARDDLIVDLDFVSEVGWVFPLPIENRQTLDLEVRAGYKSMKLTESESKRYARYHIRRVWEGETYGPWQKITVDNRSGHFIGPKLR